MTGPYDWSETQCQPCRDFKPKGQGSYYGIERHCCPNCDDEDATRVFCLNCNSDHHSGGWNTCEKDVGCRFNHPACQERLLNETLIVDPIPPACTEGLVTDVIGSDPGDEG